MERYLSVIEERVRSSRTGAQWQLHSLQAMGDTGTADQRLRALAGAMRANERTGQPVHQWPECTVAKTDQVQQIDVRDLTEFLIHLLEQGTHGTFNITGPASKTTLEEFVYGVKATSSSEVVWHWVEDYTFLEENEVYFAIPWIIPVGDNFGSQRIAIDQAKEAGLRFRPVAVTAMETLEWYRSLSPEEQAAPPMSISPEKEREVIALWRARNG